MTTIKSLLDCRVMKINVEMKAYWSLIASDYQEFVLASRLYWQAGLKVSYEEVGCNGQYEAVFWIGEKPVQVIADKKKFYSNNLNE